MEGLLWIAAIVAGHLMLGWLVIKVTNKKEPLTATQRRNLGLMINDLNRHKMGGDE